jgi:Uma2 family endonuclease
VVTTAAHVPVERLRGIRRAEFEKIAELGIFDDQRVELLYGAIVEMSPIGPRHGEAVDRANEHLMAVVRPRARVRIQGAFAASDHSEPQPDVAVLPPRDYSGGNPDVAWLIIEVAMTSLDDDRKKAALYANANVEEYWIVNLVDDVIEVHREPARGRYATITTHRRGERIRLAHFPDIELGVDDLLPPPSP